MERCYAPDGPENGLILLSRDESHHLTRVRRVGIGKTVEAFNGHGQAWLCTVQDDHKSLSVLQVIQESALSPAQSAPEICIGTAVPKGDRFDWIIEKATELGVARLIPLACHRSVVDPRSSKLERLRRSVIEACKQCGRNDLMTLDEQTPLADFLALPAPGDLALYADRGGRPMAQLASLKAAPGRIFVAIGPEGGWDDSERALFQSHGWHAVGLGPFILRVETAVVAAAAAMHAVGW